MLRYAVFLALTTLLSTPLRAEAPPTNPVITTPERPMAPTCFRIENDTLSAALYLEEIEGEAISIEGYGNVTTAEGNSWGYWQSFTGSLDGAILTGLSAVVVEGDLVKEEIQWAFVDGGLVTDFGTFFRSDCDGIAEEFTNRVAN
ncbi:MAG: hypothetical protein AAFQ09_08305 [Pseudomonadota bacterium]